MVVCLQLGAGGALITATRSRFSDKQIKRCGPPLGTSIISLETAKPVAESRSRHEVKRRSWKVGRASGLAMAPCHGAWCRGQRPQTSMPCCEPRREYWCSSQSGFVSTVGGQGLAAWASGGSFDVATKNLRCCELLALCSSDFFVDETRWL